MKSYKYSIKANVYKYGQLVYENENIVFAVNDRGNNKSTRALAKRIALEIEGSTLYGFDLRAVTDLRTLKKVCEITPDTKMEDEGEVLYEKKNKSF